ncbi:MAG: hypothetical protein R2825_04040 [Saprospiraceae bacterium]
MDFNFSGREKRAGQPAKELSEVVHCQPLAATIAFEENAVWAVRNVHSFDLFLNRFCSRSINAGSCICQKRCVSPLVSKTAVRKYYLSDIVEQNGFDFIHCP